MNWIILIFNPCTAFIFNLVVLNNSSFNNFQIAILMLPHLRDISFEKWRCALSQIVYLHLISKMFSFDFKMDMNYLLQNYAITIYRYQWELRLVHLSVTQSFRFSHYTNWFWDFNWTVLWIIRTFVTFTFLSNDFWTEQTN